MAEPLRGPGHLRRVHPATAASCGNLLLRALGADAFAWLRPHFELVVLDGGQVIVGQDDPISFVCFPESGVASVADVQSDGTRVEVALIGREGMINAQMLLGCERAPHETIVQIGGSRALRLPAEILRQFCAVHPAARLLILRFIHAMYLQTARTLAANLRDPVEKRLSRWLLLCHDRIDGDEIRLIHEHIGRVLGVRRATVTDRLHVLEGHGAIRNRRGRIVIRDRAALEALAGTSYGLVDQLDRHLIEPLGESASRDPLPMRARA